MKLVIVESPTKARTLSRFLGNDYQIVPTMGHLRDLPKNKLGVDVEKDYMPEYLMIKDRKDQIRDLKKHAKNADNIYLATDPDREGEAIAWHTKLLIEKTANSKIKRIVFHEITKSAIDESLRNPRDIDMQMVDSQQARRILDRLVGYKLSPLLWYKVRKGLSAGRVQSVAVRLIVERHREIEAFRPEEYWVIEASLRQAEKNNAGLESDQSFLARLIKKKEKKFEVKDKKTADIVVTDLKKASYVVGNIKKKEVRRNPRPPYTTSTMQQAASNIYGWTAKKTMQLAQKLYEEGYITYHRTDSTNVAKEAIISVRKLISDVWDNRYLPKKPRFYKTKSKVAQEAHEAIRPTNVWVAKQMLNRHSDIRELPAKLGREAGRLYILIWNKFVACQMTESVYDQTSIDIKADSYMLRANGSIMKFDGWQVIYGGKSDKKDEDRILPPLKVNETLKLIKLVSEQKFTQPPPFYNEASLVKALEQRGIGRPSTYAPIISTIQDRHYVEKVDRRFQPTSLGIAVNDFLVEHFSDIVDYDFTAKMEDNLDNIANGEKKWIPLIQDFYEPFNKHLSKVYKKAGRVKVETEEINESCPECDNSLVIRIGRYGKFIACSTYPKCKFTRPYIEKVGIKCPDCGGEIIIRRTKRGKRFYGCGNYPKCKFASWKKPK